jgi:hypothetical protein
MDLVLSLPFMVSIFIKVGKRGPTGVVVVISLDNQLILS